MSAHDPVALRLQRLGLQEQVLVLGHLAASRAEDRTFSPAAVTRLFHDFALPEPGKIGNLFGALATKKYFAKQPGRASYKVTPTGQARVGEQMTGLDLVALVAESAHQNAPVLGRLEHALVPVHMAPPGLVQPLRGFLADHPFETNVFGMTRFPDAKAGTADPVGRALAVTKEVCAEAGLEFHLASDRALVDDLWDNVIAHVWASRYGVGYFEDRVDRGLNHNLLIEVGAMIMSGRRVALLKDGSIERMPTDFVGKIYKSVDLSSEDSVADAVRAWIRDDLSVGIL
ncbi:hypothetical protein GCM10011490_00250 [Pseudoclavibacter endophyticus]|uniref:Uncharacterized protein n=1 Tax=Pseudoclavibacter endophyticus TaxID=1778590 RepID=A0A6H9WS05_9MICO|nr:hypothetical protein [Pseudoclavibacter endophyticus]KAB1650401.1 hypothetical protein F8O04_09585 [Pseudoclavibacter endophyticus]GGA54449.1 hypothetical protein GCM10011490_00250 [Pseudoclavibacter endophyticus]